tara:strand:+ start:4434 stop:4931 length:498 start_codon:yes stop_codon:yes gene_type:complete
MSFIDIFLSVIIIWGGYNGFLNGLVKEISSFLGLISGIYLAKNYYKFLDNQIYLIFDKDEDYLSIISVAIIFLIVILVFKILEKFITKFLNLVALGLLNKIAGTIFGVLKLTLILCLLIFIFSKVNNSSNIIDNKKLEKSIIYNQIQKINKVLIQNNYEENGNEE